MQDEQFVAAFERGGLSGGEFTHAGHVRVAWWYLKRYDFTEALERFRTALRRFAAAQGAAGRYHETITVAYLLIIAGRLDETPELSWVEFAGRHADVLSRTPPILARYYTNETLQSERAKGTFVRPDREELPMMAHLSSIDPRRARVDISPPRPDASAS